MSFISWLISLFVKKPVVPVVIGGNKMKKVFSFGINDYPGSNNDLSGCINDAKNWSQLLQNQYGFTIWATMFDSAATRYNVKNEMLRLITTAQAGDVLVITYSGHGTTQIDRNGDEADGKDEAICLYDGNMADDEIREIFSKLPQGVKLTFISDSCHSGSVTRAFLGTMNDSSFYSKPKYMPPEDTMEASLLASLPTLRAFGMPEGDMNHVLISGCRDLEYSYDANIGGQPTGAFSYYAIQVLKANPKITYNEFYEKLRSVLPSSRYPQTPQLEGSDSNKNSVMFE